MVRVQKHPVYCKELFEKDPADSKKYICQCILQVKENGDSEEDVDDPTSTGNNFVYKKCLKVIQVGICFK